MIRAILSSFNGGELSPRMMGRVDTAIYQIGLETCENFVPTVEGPIVKRPGFEYICAADDTSTWLGAFRFNITQDYVIEWAEEKVRLFTNGGRIETSPGVAYEVATPYAAAAASRICTQQSFDRLYLNHPDYPPAALKRTAATTFAHEVLTLNGGPFLDQNSDEGVTVTVSATTGSGITVTAVGDAIFEAGHVGALFEIEAKDFSDIKAWEVGRKNITAGMVVRSDGKAYVAATSGTTGSVQPTHTRGSEWDGTVQNDIADEGPYGVQWTYRHDRRGVVRITAVAGDGLSATATVIRRLPDSLTSVASHRWAHSAYSDAEGWPGLVAIWNGRRIDIKDFDVIGSVVGDYGGGQVNYAVRSDSGGLDADQGFRRVLSIANPPLWVAGDRKALIVGTATAEIAIGPVNAAAALSGENISSEPQSYFGSAAVWPVQIAATTIFAQRGRKKLREVGYDFARDRYLATNMTVWCRHVTGPGIVQMAFQQEPEELLFAVRADGQLAVHPHAPEQEIKGFARIVPGGGGRVLSATCVTDEAGVNDELWCLIERDGAKSIERMAAWREDGDPIAEAFFVDAGVRYSASAGQSHFTGATHLAGKAVAILAGGAVVPGVTVAGDGSFDLPTGAAPSVPFTLIVGLPYTARAVTLRPEVKSQGGTIQALKQRLVKIALRVLETAGVRVGQSGRLYNLFDRPASTPMDTPPELFTGDSTKGISGNIGTDGRAEFVSDDPLPATIVAAIAQVEWE